LRAYNLDEFASAFAKFSSDEKNHTDKDQPNLQKLSSAVSQKEELY
jgi:hypothetical protein